MRRVRRSVRRLHNRRGVTLVLTIFFLAIMMGVATLAIDMGAMYLYRNELQSAADASALAGAIGLGRGEGVGAQTDVSTYLGKNVVGGVTPTLTDMTAGTWDGTFHAGSWTDATANAVQVHVSYPASWIFGNAFGRLFSGSTPSGRTLHATAVAVHGGVKGFDCVRPWAFSYQFLLDKLFGKGVKTTSYDLTTADVARLHAMTITDADTVVFEGVRLPPGEYGADSSGGGSIPGGSKYRAEEGFQTCAQLDALMATASPPPPTNLIGPGDWLKPETGFKTGPTKQGINDLCGSDTCSPPYPIIVALYKGTADAPGGHCAGCWQIKYMTAFYLTGFDNTSKSPRGYFRDTAVVVGGFIPTAGPVAKNALVK